MTTTLIVTTSLNTTNSLLGAIDSAPEGSVVVVDDSWSSKVEDTVAGTRASYIKSSTMFGGFGQAVNHALSTLSDQRVLLIHDDVLLGDGFNLDQMNGFMDNEPDIAVVSALQLHPRGTVSNSYTILTFDNGLYQIRAQYVNWYPEAKGVVTNLIVPAVRSGVWLLDVEKFKSVGGFDQMFSPAMYEDIDLCLALRQAGHKIMYTPLSIAIHDTGTTLKSGAFNLDQLSSENSNRLMEKWSGNQVFSFRKEGL